MCGEVCAAKCVRRSVWWRSVCNEERKNRKREKSRRDKGTKVSISSTLKCTSFGSFWRSKKVSPCKMLDIQRFSFDTQGPL